MTPCWRRVCCEKRLPTFSHSTLGASGVKFGTTLKVKPGYKKEKKNEKKKKNTVNILVIILWVLNFNREAMKEFDSQIRESGRDVPEYHTEDWYEAMSWYGLRRTQAWKDFEKKNSKEAELYKNLIKKQKEQHEERINKE